MAVRTEPEVGPRSRMRPPGIEIRFSRPGDIEGVNCLYNDPAARPGAAARGYVPRTEAQWSWEYSVPAEGRPAYTVATHAGRVVGTQAYIPIELLVDGAIVRSGKDEDTLIQPAYRGMGLLDDMYRLLFGRAADDDVAVLWGFTTTAVRPLLRNGYHSLGRFEAMQAEVAAAGGGDAPAEVMVREITAPDEQCDRFSLEFGRWIGGITVHLSAKYLRWRVYDNPYRSSRVFGAWVGGDLAGLGVFKLDDPSGMGYVSELAAFPAGSTDVGTILWALTGPGMQAFRHRGYRRAEARFPGTHPFNQQIRSMLVRRGFAALPSEKAAEFLVRPTRSGETPFLAMESWRLSELMREY